MRVTQRLYLAALPSLVGLVLIAALAYWGQYAYQVPELFLVVAGFITVVTMAMSWANVRYVARRVERLSHRNLQGSSEAGLPSERARPSAGSHDELDHIEGALASLDSTVELMRDARARDALMYETSTAMYANLLANVSTIGLQKLDEVRLPLHILLENHFGDLNENQEELLGAARVAAERASTELSALRRLAEFDLGIVRLRQDRVFPAELLRAVLPMIQSTAAQRQSFINADIPPLMPAVRADAAQLQEAFVVLFGDAASQSLAGDRMQLSMSTTVDAVILKLGGAKRPPQTVRTVLAERIVQLSGGTSRTTDDGVGITLPHDGARGGVTGFSK